jgi:hypothetical protein
MTYQIDNGSSHGPKGENGAVSTGIRNDPTTGDTTQTNLVALIEKGMKCESKRLWENKEPFSDEVSWVDEMPSTIKARLELAGAKGAEFALLLRTQLSHSQPKLHSIVVQSPLLKAALKDVLHDYPGIFLGKDPLVFESPFKPFVHRWDALKNACAQGGETEATRHLELLRSTLEPELQKTFSTIKDFASDGAIEFDQLWTVFAPGTVVISPRGKSDCAFSITKTEFFVSKMDRRTYFILHCYCIDWDGTRFGRAPQSLVIPEFEGIASPADLIAYPLEFHPQKDLLIAKLTKRGEKFQAYADTLNKAYDGIAVDNGRHPPASYHVCLPMKTSTPCSTFTLN